MWPELDESEVLQFKDNIAADLLPPAGVVQAVREFYQSRPAVLTARRHQLAGRVGR